MADLLIRAARIEDLAALTEIYNHYVQTSQVTFDIEPFTVEKRREWFGHYAETGPHRLLVAVAGGAGGAGGTHGDDGRDPIGYATSGRLRPKPAYATSVETSVYVHPDARCTGVGTALYAALFDALAKEDVHRAYAGIALPNPASVALHLRFGFREIGTYREVGRKFGRYWDVQWFERELP
jgi:phosphinothricin acetyltransferase